MEDKNFFNGFILSSFSYAHRKEILLQIFILRFELLFNFCLSEVASDSLTDPGFCFLSCIVSIHRKTIFVLTNTKIINDRKKGVINKVSNPMRKGNREV
jgi:hypothetical protein